MEDVPCDQLANVLEFIIPYHTRQKMHPIRGKKYGKNWKREPSEPERDLSTPPASAAIRAKSSLLKELLPKGKSHVRK